MTTTTSL